MPIRQDQQIMGTSILAIPSGLYKQIPQQPNVEPIRVISDESLLVPVTDYLAWLDGILRKIHTEAYEVLLNVREYPSGELMELLGLVVSV